MKKLLSLLLVALLSLGTITGCGGSNSTSIANSKLAQQIKTICQKEIVKTALNGKKIGELLKESVNNMTDSAKKEAQSLGISLDPSNFANDDSTYAWLANAVKLSVKSAIDKGQITQEQIDQGKGVLTMLGIKLPDIKIEKGLSDSEISKLCEAYADVVDRFTDPATLKMLGIDLNDPSTFESLIKSFSNFKLGQ